MTNNADKQYFTLCEHILENGVEKDDRTGTGTLSAFGYQMRFDLSEGFPLLTTKRLPFRVIAEELRWFLSGSTNLKDLLDVNVNIWNADAYRDYSYHYNKNGMTYEKHSSESFIEAVKEYGYDLGPIYGRQWRGRLVDDDGYGAGNYADQIADVIEGIKHNPDSRRHIVSAWNVKDLDRMALPPCHVLFQFYVANGKLSCQLYQRSADVFLGLPFNIASYTLLTHMIAKICGLEVGEFIHTIGDAHIYKNHIEQVREQLTREPRPLPTLSIKRKVEDPAEYTMEDFELRGYNPHEKIVGEVSVGL